MTDTTFMYVTYITTTPEKLWEALTSGDFTRKYWFGTTIQSDWQEGSPVIFLDGSNRITDNGEVLKCEPYRLLSYTFQVIDDSTVREQPSKVTYMLQPMGSTVRLTLKHENLVPGDLEDGTVRTFGIQNGWPVVLSGLKSLLETGQPIILTMRPGADSSQPTHSIEKSFIIHATRREVWEALVNPDRVREWSGAAAKVSDVVGTEFSIWDGHLWGTVTGVQSQEYLEQAWHSIDMQQVQPTKVTFRLAELEGKTHLVLQHENIVSLQNKQSFAIGWDDKYLGPLKRYVERRALANH